MRTRQAIISERQPAWRRLEELVEKAEQVRGPRSLEPPEISELAAEYRALASDLMRVRRDRMGADLERHLDGLAARAHNTLHSGGRGAGTSRSAWDIVLDFPGAVRRNATFFWLATFLFYGPALAAGASAFLSETYALAILDPSQLSSLEAMYKEAPQGRAPSTNAAMTGFYVWNNVGIAFRCFATGILFGLGSIWFLVFNGLFLGIAFGHLGRVGLGYNLFTFVSTHGPWELTAIVLSGAAGMQMGMSAIITHGRTRIGNLQAMAPELLRQVVGAALFLGLAAALEGWLSPSSIPPESKIAIGGLGWVLVGLLLTGSGRRRSLPPDVARRRTPPTPNPGSP